MSTQINRVIDCIIVQYRITSTCLWEPDFIGFEGSVDVKDDYRLEPPVQIVTALYREVCTMPTSLAIELAIKMVGAGISAGEDVFTTSRSIVSALRGATHVEQELTVGLLYFISLKMPPRSLTVV